MFLKASIGIALLALAITPAFFIDNANAQQSCGTLAVSVNNAFANFTVTNGQPGERIWVITYDKTEKFSGHSPINIAQDGTGKTTITLTGDQYRAFLSQQSHSKNESDVPCSNTVDFNVEKTETKMCVKDTYQGQPTYCSASAVNRTKVPYGGCQGLEICVTDFISTVDTSLRGECNEDEITTAIGCIPIGSTSGLIAFILRWAIGIGGGVAFLLMIYAGFIIMTSTGNPERLKGGQELLTSAIAGLIMLIFSIFILRFIGVNILQIPGFGT